MKAVDKKRRSDNIFKRRKLLNTNFTKKELIRQARESRCFVNASETKKRIITLILLNEFGSIHMGNGVIHARKIIFKKG